MCGLIISTLSWEYVFYITGLLGFVWSVLWFILVFDSPASHPRITPEEREYIESRLIICPYKELGHTNEEKKISQGGGGAGSGQNGDPLLADDNSDPDHQSNAKAHDDHNRNYSTFTQNGNANCVGDNSACADTARGKESATAADSDLKSSSKGDHCSAVQNGGEKNSAPRYGAGGGGQNGDERNSKRYAENNGIQASDEKSSALLPKTEGGELPQKEQVSIFFFFWLFLWHNLYVN